MTKRSVYTVTHKNNEWNVKEVGQSSPAGKTNTKVEAVQKAKALAKRSELGQVRIHGKDGKIQTEYTYGKDPRKTKG